VETRLGFSELSESLQARQYVDSNLYFILERNLSSKDESNIQASNHREWLNSLAHDVGKNVADDFFIFSGYWLFIRHILGKIHDPEMWMATIYLTLMAHSALRMGFVARQPVDYLYRMTGVMVPSSSELDGFYYTTHCWISDENKRMDANYQNLPSLLTEDPPASYYCGPPYPNLASLENCAVGLFRDPLPSFWNAITGASGSGSPGLRPSSGQMACWDPMMSSPSRGYWWCYSERLQGLLRGS